MGLKKKMYNITKDEALSLLQKLRQIRQKSGEAIAFLEHMIQLQGEHQNEYIYNPDDYLERLAYGSNASETSWEKRDCQCGKELYQ